MIRETEIQRLKKMMTPDFIGHVDMKLQDAGSSRLPGQVPVYHSHGLRQYHGTCKIHRSLDCQYLVHWKPGFGLSKTIMREWNDTYSQVPVDARCHRCFHSHE